MAGNSPRFLLRLRVLEVWFADGVYFSSTTHGMLERAVCLPFRSLLWPAA